MTALDELNALKKQWLKGELKEAEYRKKAAPLVAKVKAEAK